MLKNIFNLYIFLHISIITVFVSAGEANNNLEVAINPDTNLLELANVQEFINMMVEKHSFDRNELKNIFAQVKFIPKVVSSVKAPAEAFSWNRYKKIFLSPARIKGGAAFWHKHKDTLERMQDKFGIPPEIVIAIIGVETKYGSIQGKFQVINSLSTLAFGYTNRVKFFRSELEQFLLLTKEQGFDPFVLKGSYAGAMGIPQFISSSWRNYAVDFSESGNNDIINNVENAIGSVANYFHKHGWQTNMPVVEKIKLTGNNYQSLLSKKRRPAKPLLKNEDFAKNELKIDKVIPENTAVSLLAFNDDSSEHATEFYLGYNNFYVITRYNFSSNYAMAVYELSRAIKAEYLNNYLSKKTK